MSALATDPSRHIRNPGSIAFARLKKDMSETYTGGGESPGQAYQTGEVVTPHAVMSYPKGVVETADGQIRYKNSEGKLVPVTAELLRQEQFKPFMKEFAQNLRDITPEGQPLLSGAQELLSPTKASNTAMGGKEFIDLINSQDTTEGRNTTIGQSILDIASGKTTVREGLSGFEGKKSRDIAETLARGRGFLDPVQQTTDEEIDRMMSEGTGLEVLRGANKTSLENLTTDKSSQTPISAYDEGGTGLYFSVEAASDKMIKEKGIDIDPKTKAHFTAGHYAIKPGEKANPEGAVMRAVLPSDAKIGSKRDPKYKQDVGTRLDVIAKDLDDMEKAGQDVSHARHVLSALRETSYENSAADILSGYDAVAQENNEVRLINRTAALSSGVKSPAEIKQLYPETPRKDRLGGSGTMRKYDESPQQRQAMAEERHRARTQGETPKPSPAPAPSTGSQSLNVGTPVNLKAQVTSTNVTQQTRSALESTRTNATEQ